MGLKVEVVLVAAFLLKLIECSCVPFPFNLIIVFVLPRVDYFFCNRLVSM